MELKTLNIPNHIAFIMDGNGRWAVEKGLPRTMGHKVGVDTLKKIIKSCDKIGVKIVTVYAFSTENWKRPKAEVNFLMNLLLEFMKKEIDELKKEHVKIRVLGDLTPIPKATRAEIDKAIEETKENTGLQFNIALNYGGRLEIIHAVKAIGQKLLNEELSVEDIDDKMFSQYLYTQGEKDPELVIRTSGEKRLSNFLLWQSAYSELVFVDCFWPDFDEKGLMLALKEYTDRDRRFGAVK